MRNSPPLRLPLNRPLPALAQLHAHYGVGCSALITAHNPAGRRLSAAANRRRQWALQRQLQGVWPLLPASGSDPLRHWPTESSLLIFGISQPQACQIASAWQQNAILWSGSEAIMRLLWLR